jgi:hypothetical protein
MHTSNHATAAASSRKFADDKQRHWITAAQFKTILRLDDEGRTVIADLIRPAIRPARQAPASDPGGTPQDR